MRHHSAIALSSGLLLVLGAHAVAAQANAYRRIAGTWVMDSTNGPDDHGLPKSETLVFATTPQGVRITATEDDGKGPATSSFNCASVNGSAASAKGNASSTTCTVRATADSVAYALDVRNKGALVATERGRLVVSADGESLRDEYDATDGPKPATHHRHIYNKSAGRTAGSP